MDVIDRLLYGSKGVVPLTPKAFDTLLALVEQSGHVLAKEELMKRVWPDSFVEENNLAQNISTLRKVLSEEAEGGQKYIETVSKRGYRFVAEVRENFGEAERSPDAEGADNQMQTGSNERQREKPAPFHRDVVIIGRAIDFE